MNILAAGGLLEPTDITRLLVALAMLLGLAKLLGELATRWRQPSVLGEILAGVLLGQTVLGQILAEDTYQWIFPETGAAAIALEGLIALSAILLLLVAGLEVDLSSVWKQGKTTLLVSLTGMVIPFAIGFGIAHFAPKLLGFDLATEGDYHLPFSLFIGIALSITALPVIAKILMDLHMSKSDLGVVVMSSAMVNDLVGWIGFAMILALIPDGSIAVGQAVDAAAQAVNGAESAGADTGGGPSIATTIVMTLVFLVAMLTVGRAIVHRMLPTIQAYWSWPGGTLMFVMVVAFGAAAVTEALRVHSIFGAFIAGVIIGDSSHLRERTRDTIHQFITHIFAPLFFASIGLRVNFIEAFNPMLVIIVLVIACAGKILGCYAGAKWAGMTPRESWAVGFGMTARGAMEIILAQLAYNKGLINKELFVAIVIMALVTSLIAGPAMEKLLQRKVKRTLGDLLSDRHFVGQLKAHTRRDVITELAERAADVTQLSRSMIDESVWEREGIISSGIGDRIAVPHARLPEIKEPIIIVGRHPIGIDFNARDGENARIICMLLSNTDDPSGQIELLEVVSTAFSDPAVREHALDAASFTEFLAALKLGHKPGQHA